MWSVFKARLYKGLSPSCFWTATPTSLSQPTNHKACWEVAVQQHLKPCTLPVPSLKPGHLFLPMFHWCQGLPTQHNMVCFPSTPALITGHHKALMPEWAWCGCRNFRAPLLQKAECLPHILLTTTIGPRFLVKGCPAVSELGSWVGTGARQSYFFVLHLQELQQPCDWEILRIIVVLKSNFANQ